MNGAFFEKSAPFKSILTSVRLFISTFKHLVRALSRNSCNRQTEGQTDRQIDRSTMVTLAAHARRRLISVPCTTPYFHKDTLTPPSSSRSPPFEGGGPAINLYIMHALYFEIYTPLEGIQLMSIAGYEAFVCVCFFVYKTLCATLHMAAV